MEFINWLVILEEEPNEFNPLFYYLAALRADVMQINSTKRIKIKLEDKLLKFISGTEKDKKETVTDPEEVKKRIEESKRSWMAAVGYGMKKTRPGKTPKKVKK